MGRRTGSGAIALGEVHSWSPETPNLYELYAAIDEGDRIESYFGLRKLDVRDGRFWLNGAPYIQRLVLDQGYFPGGLMTAPTVADLRRDIEVAKAMGFNGARKHQKIEDPRWLYWADRLGFLVWGEMPSFHEDSPEARRRLAAEWTEVVRRDRDHPSIVAWVPANESFGLVSGAATFLDDMHGLTKTLDPSRPAVSNDGWEQATTDLCTLHDYGSPAELATRYRALESALAPDARPRPAYLPGYSHRGEPVIVSEFGGIALAGSGGFGWSEAKDQMDLLETYRQLVDALMAPGPVEGFCYTQLADVEQERNGLLTADREPKVDPALLHPITQTAKR